MGVAGCTGDGGAAAAARINTPTELAQGSDGSLHIADSGNNLIRRVDPSGIISTVAGKRGFGR